MPERARVAQDLNVEEKLIILLKNRNYRFILRFFDNQFGFRIRTEQSGATFGTCIDWCAQNAGKVEEVHKVLLLMFDKFYRYLPPNVRDDFAELAAEVGYSRQEPFFTGYDELLRRLLVFRHPTFSR
jgi:hypothetical protein